MTNGKYTGCYARKQVSQNDVRIKGVLYSRKISLEEREGKKDESWMLRHPEFQVVLDKYPDPEFKFEPLKERNRSKVGFRVTYPPFWSRVLPLP